jgi:hypothetical protein
MITVAIAKAMVPTVAAWTPSTSRGGTSACRIRWPPGVSAVTGTSEEVSVLGASGAGSLTHSA